MAVFVAMSQLTLLNVNKVLFLNPCSWIYSAQHSTEPEQASLCLLTGQAQCETISCHNWGCLEFPPSCSFKARHRFQSQISAANFQLICSIKVVRTSCLSGLHLAWASEACPCKQMGGYLGKSSSKSCSFVFISASYLFRNVNNLRQH